MRVSRCIIITPGKHEMRSTRSPVHLHTYAYLNYLNNNYQSVYSTVAERVRLDTGWLNRSAGLLGLLNGAPILLNSTYVWSFGWMRYVVDEIGRLEVWMRYRWWYGGRRCWGGDWQQRSQLL